MVAEAAPLPLSDPGNPHNMSSGSNEGLDVLGRELHKAAPEALGGTDQVCIFCHTPHSAAPKTPLWSRPNPTGMGSFPVYAQSLGIKNSAVLTGYEASNPDYPSGASRMCLSCHDGVTSIGVLLGSKNIVMVGGDKITTGDPTINAVINLATSHPISFKYNQNVVNAIDPSNNDYQVPVEDYTPLDSSGQMQCTTCHDPHLDTRGDPDYDSLPFWRHNGGVASYDEVCNSCHKAPPSSSAPTHALP